MNWDKESIYLVGGVLGFLLLASIAGWIIAKTVRSERAVPTIKNLNARIRAWWMMVIIFLIAMSTGGTGSYILFGLTSFWALREFITLTPTRLGDHRVLFYVFFVITPLQYYLLSI